MGDLNWTCGVCTYLNNGSGHSCAMCNTLRSSPVIHTHLLFPPLAQSRRRGLSSGGSSSSSSSYGRALELSPLPFSVCGVQRFLAGAVSGALTGMFAVVGAFTGAVTGALAGRATESGLLRGAGVGAIAGAVLSVEVLEASWAYWHSEQSGSRPLSSVAEFLEDFLSGRYVQDHSSPAVPSAHHWQVNLSEMSYDDLYELFGSGDVCAKGVSEACLLKLPWHKISEKTHVDASGDAVGCTICLQEMHLGEKARALPPCHHIFHMSCVDRWLMIHDSCPVCRQEIGRFCN